MNWASIVVGCGICSVILYAYFKQRRKNRESVRKMIQSLLDNMKQNLGIKPDSDSILWLTEHASLTAFMYDILGKSELELIQENAASGLKSRLRSIIDYGTFAEKYPAACALFDYVHWYADITLSKGRWTVPESLKDAPIFQVQ